MVGWADCRLCKWFTQVEELDERIREQAIAWIAERRTGSRLLGYCRYYNRPVTYYEGYCNAFKRLPGPPPGVMPLTRFMDGGG